MAVGRRLREWWSRLPSERTRLLGVVLPFVVVMLWPFVLQLTAEPRSTPLVVLSLVVTIATVIVRIGFAARLGEVGETATALVYMGAVVMLSVGGIKQTGSELLLLLPILATALYGTVRQLLAVFVGAALAVSLPFVFDPTLTTLTAGWQDLSLGYAVALLMGWTVFLLVRDLQSRGAALELALTRLDELAREDALTGVSNRRAWDEGIAAALLDARATGEPLSVAMLDLDDFKIYNDTRGHLVGDRLLSGVATAWKAALGQDDVLARVGGDEFLLAMPRRELEPAIELVEHLRSLVPHGSTCSAGLAAWDREEHADALVQRADQALYRAKSEGRNRLVVADAMLR